MMGGKKKRKQLHKIKFMQKRNGGTGTLKKSQYNQKNIRLQKEWGPNTIKLLASSNGAIRTQVSTCYQGGR